MYSWKYYVYILYLQSIVQEIVSGQEKRKSAGPTAGEYRELIKANLKTASEYLIIISLIKKEG